MQYHHIKPLSIGGIPDIWPYSTETRDETKNS
jgi:hypothetical protein